MDLTQLVIRPATKDDTLKVQEIRKRAWQARYVNPESGVTQKLLTTSLAKLPPDHNDIKHYHAMLNKPLNKNKNLVATLNGQVIGTVCYDSLESGIGDIGVFVADGFNDKGVGDKLLDKLIADTDNPLQVIIFAKNPSREFYKRHGFVEDDKEERHYFRDGVYLPTQTLKLSR